jgi:hypothetical protein
MLQAPQLGPFPGPRSVVVLDNCAIHHDDEVRELIVGECGKLSVVYYSTSSINDICRS